uniref:Sentrin-specific protease 8 (Trinotate prediction) n=1 Tax=Myxobolus squamalis TaxID=59785 RepID=A0A6B2G4D5_MYXSQ
MKLLKMESGTEIKQAALYKVGDCQIDEYDVDCIANHDFLTDRTLLFFITYFYTKFAKEFKKKVEIISPEVVHLIKMVDESKEILIPLKLNTKKLIILLINDCVSAESGGGSHWSLLVYYQKSNSFYHFDSMGNSNGNHASIVADKVTEVLDGFLNYLILISASP